MSTYRGGGGFGDLLGELLELSVKHLPTLALLLFELDFIFVAVSVLPLAVSSLVELHVRCFAEELDILMTGSSEVVLPCQTLKPLHEPSSCRS